MINKREFWGLLILIVGLVLLLTNFPFIDHSVRRFLRDLWPLILIVIGVALIIRHARQKPSESHGSEPQTGPQIAGGFSKTFGDIDFDLRDREIDGLSIGTTFGDITVNLAGAKLKNGANRLRLSGVFGDMTVIVPSGMEAFAYASTTFGDIHIFGKSVSGISNNLQNQTDGYEAATIKVHISAGTTFGDIKIFRA